MHFRHTFKTDSAVFLRKADGWLMEPEHEVAFFRLVKKQLSIFRQDFFIIILYIIEQLSYILKGRGSREEKKEGLRFFFPAISNSSNCQERV